MTQTQDMKQEEKLYKSGVKEAGKLDAEYGKKANIVQKAYEAAVAELGLSDKELLDQGKAKKVAKLMFSNKYLGNSQFNPLMKDSMYKGFSEKSSTEQQQLYEHMLGMNLDSFVRTNGIIDSHGGLQRTTIATAVERNYSGMEARQLMAMTWQKVYDPEKGLGENMKSYVAALQQDPILAGTGAKVDAGKFESVDDVAQALATSFMGRSTREGYQYKHGANFN
jgi:hypothetical protein